MKKKLPRRFSKIKMILISYALKLYFITIIILIVNLSLYCKACLNENIINNLGIKGFFKVVCFALIAFSTNIISENT